MASLKFLNLKVLSNLGMPSSVMICHSGICGCNPLISSAVTDGAPTRQASHFCSVSSSIHLSLHNLNDCAYNCGITSRANCSIDSLTRGCGTLPMLCQVRKCVAPVL